MSHPSLHLRHTPSSHCKCVAQSATLQYVNPYTQPVAILAIANTRSAVEPVCLGPWLPFVTMATSPGPGCTNLSLTHNDLDKAAILLYKITGLW